jgi:glycosyltransferase involved in cell wall biosynthesis
MLPHYPVMSPGVAKMPGQVKVLVLAQTPPPYHGQAVILDKLVRAPFERIRIYHVRMAFSRSLRSMGRFEARKVTHLLRIICRALFVRFRHGVRILYYPPAGPTRNAVLRDIALLLALRGFFTKTIFSFHAAGVSEFLERQPRWLKFLAVRAYAQPDGAIELSRLLPADGEYFGAKAVRIIPNGVEDAAARLPRDHTRQEGDELRVLYVGFISDWKGSMELLEAVRQLRTRHANLRLTLIGEFISADVERRAKAFCEQHDLGNVVYFAGALVGDEKWDCFRRGDVLCMPSYHPSEGLPVVILEAMMWGLPVVATRWGGIPDLVTDGVTGLLVPVRDPSALAKALDVLFTDDALRRRMGACGRRAFLERLTLERHLRDTEEFLLEVAAA